MRNLFWTLLPFLAVSLFSVLGVSCAVERTNPVVEGQDIRMTFLHTSDIHSRLLPFDMTVLASDRKLGLDPAHGPFGGIARIAHVIKQERARNERVLYVDSGDCFQGAPIFNVFHGEIEQRAMSLLRPDAVVIGNHEFDEGITNFVTQISNWATYPVLAANYEYVPGNPLAELARPYHIANVGGIKVGFIGIANFSSISSITDVGNSLGILPMENAIILQEYIDFLTPFVDLVVGVSHAGLTEDEEIIQHTDGFDLIFGGHLHVALNPPKVIKDLTGRDVVLVHSGAFAKYVGKLDVVFRDGQVINHKYTLIPIDGRIPEEATMLTLLEPYKQILEQTIDLTSVFAYASKLIRRIGFGGGDSPLGNLVAEAIRFYARTDFAITNTLGIRSDISKGPITYDSIFNVFPFNNTVTTMFISGVDIQNLLDYVTKRSAGRGCNSQVQVAGLRFIMDCRSAETPCQVDGSECCPKPCADQIRITSCARADIGDQSGCVEEPLQLDAIYELATNDYIAHGGSGFTILKSNNTQFDTELPLREAVVEQFLRAGPCRDECLLPDGRMDLQHCSTYQGCVESLSHFHNRRCRKLDTTDLGMRVSDYCGHDSGRCATTEDCLNVDELCGDGQCNACQHFSDCPKNGCDGGACRCEQGFCIADRVTCLNGRCVVSCATNADCTNTDDKTQLNLCIDGGCQPQTATSCLSASDCNPALLYCFGAGSGACIEDSACQSGERCLDRRCVKAPGQCQTNNDCPDGQRCQLGWCGPDRSCSSDSNCQEGSCVQGLCQTTCAGCQNDQHCSNQQICARGLCVPRLANCEQHRCRLSCNPTSAQATCPIGTQCHMGSCLPNACREPRSAQKRCMIKNESLNAERCLSISCPHAESDGRIKRILPANLEDLPSDLNPDDPEG